MQNLEIKLRLASNFTPSNQSFLTISDCLKINFYFMNLLGGCKPRNYFSSPYLFFSGFALFCFEGNISLLSQFAPGPAVAPSAASGPGEILVVVSGQSV